MMVCDRLEVGSSLVGMRYVLLPRLLAAYAKGRSA